MKCLRCGNEEIDLFYHDGKGWYCRNCIKFGKVYIKSKLRQQYFKVSDNIVKARLEYELTSFQKEISKKLVLGLKKQKKYQLVYAVCGAGKTEIILESIEYAINNQLKVGIAIPRRQVVLEIRDRLQNIFKNIEIIAVCQGNTNKLDADIIVCTMHQLYRYHQTFDLLIMDEIDAFPYSNNDLLKKISINSCKNNIIYLSATPSDEFLFDNDIEIYKLFERPHGYPLIKPELLKIPKIMNLIVLLLLLKRFISINQPLMIFVPTIRKAKLLSLLFKCKVITSETINKEEIIEQFRNDKDVLICTTIMERGVTFEGVNVIVYQCDHNVFTKESLIQINGRVGRKKRYEKGKCIFIYNKLNEEIKKCVKTIEEINGK